MVLVAPVPGRLSVCIPRGSYCCSAIRVWSVCACRGAVYVGVAGGEAGCTAGMCVWCVQGEPPSFVSRCVRVVSGGLVVMVMVVVVVGGG